METKEFEKKYPEHAKLDKVKGESQAIGEFLDWYRGKAADDEGYYGAPTERLLAEYFGVNLKILEKEKRQMLKAFQEAISK